MKAVCVPQLKELLKCTRDPRKKALLQRKASPPTPPCPHQSDHRGKFPPDPKRGRLVLSRKSMFHFRAHSPGDRGRQPHCTPTFSWFCGDCGVDIGLSGGDESTSTGSSSFILMSGVEGRDMSRGPAFYRENICALR